MRANQGFYKFKKDIKRIAYDTQAITGKVIDLRNNVDGYAIVGSTEGDMIKSVGKNLLDVKDVYAKVTSPYIMDCYVEEGSVIYINFEDGYKTSNSQVFSQKLRISVSKPCTVVYRTEHISGVYERKDEPGIPTVTGHQTLVEDFELNAIRSSYSSVYVGTGIGEVRYNLVNITQEDIDNGASSVSVRLWSNGTLKGGTKYVDYRYTIMGYVVDLDEPIDEDIEFEPYKEDRKVCNQNDRCYINTFANGSVYSENNRTITVNFPKSMFASAYRAIANRVNNMDGDDYEEKTVNFFGDSITAGTNTTEAYHMWLSRYTGFHCKNWGVGGSGYIQELTGSFHTGDGIEGIAELKPQTGNNKILTIMKSVGELGNCMIFAGTNDWAAAYDIDAFRTAVQNTLDYAWEHSDRLLVLTPIKRYRGEVKNSAGKRLHEFSGVVIEECIKRGIPYIDGYEMPFDSNNDISALKYYAKEGVDKVHINEAGHKLMAGYLLDRFKAVFK